MKYGSRKRFLAAAALPLALAVSGCGDQGEEETIASTTTPQVSTTTAPVITTAVVDSTPAAAADTTSEGGTSSTTSAPAPGGARTTRDAVFTAAQADRGQSNFQTFCTSCHTATDFRGSHFQQNWGARTVGDLYSFISTNMPMDAPGSLTSEQYTEIIAYFLRQNNYPAGGTALPAAEASLRQIRFASPG